MLALQDGHGPFPGCPHIWADRPGPCLCAVPVAAGDFADAWAQARETDRRSNEGGRPALWDVCQDAAYQLIEYPDENQDPELGDHLRDMAYCTGLCFAQQMLAAEAWAHPATARRALADLFGQAGRSRSCDRTEAEGDGRERQAQTDA